VLAGEHSLAFTEVATDRLDIVDEHGLIGPAVVPAVRVGKDGPHGRCGWQVQGAPVTVPLDGPVAFGGWWVRIGYLSSGDSPVRVRAGSVSRDTTVRAGVHALYFEGGPQFRSVTIDGLVDGVTLCTDDVTVGRVAPASALEESTTE
jgi:hypothetical protein